MKKTIGFISLILFCFLQVGCEKQPFDEEIKKVHKEDKHEKKK